MTKNLDCRACRGTNLTMILSLGKMPPANAFLNKNDLKKKETSFPLDVYFCRTCGLVQLKDIVSPTFLFRNYVYVSSTSPLFIAHFKSFADSVRQRFDLSPGSLVVDIGSNDGILLRPFKEFGMKVLGVDPALKIAEEATKNGIETWPEFFTPELAKKIVKKKGNARIITATNVFAHVNDLDSLLTGVKELLAANGVLIIEAPYLVDFIEKNLFDTIYHEHVSYLAVKPLTVLFKRLGMEIFDVEKSSSHGGSLRVFVQKNGGGHSIKKSVEEFVETEKEKGLYSIKTYRDFAKKVDKNRKELKALLVGLRSKGKKIVGYGAPAKGNTLLNYAGINSELDYIIDDSPWKQNLYTPGTHIPVVAYAKVELENPEYVLILAWNFASQIIEKLKSLKKRGTKFIVPVPNPKII